MQTLPGVGRAVIGPRGPHGDGTDVAFRRALSEPIQPLLVGEQHLRAAVLESVFHLLGLPQSIHRHRDRAYGCGRCEGKDPFRVVAHGDSDTVALHDAVLMYQEVGDPGSVAIGGGERQALVVKHDERLVAPGICVERAKR